MTAASLAPFLRRHAQLVRVVRRTYPLLNWLRNRRVYYVRRAPFLATLRFDQVRFSNRGNEPEPHLRRTRRLRSVRSADVLVIGVRSGEELGLWLDERPRSLSAIDVMPHWEEWGRYPEVTFACMDARRLEFPDASFDVVTSTAVLEHIDGVESAVSEMARVVRPDGIVFANFGPLYRTFGGAHYWSAYEHLWMTDRELELYLVARNDEEELGEGLFYLRNRMFSRLTIDEYLQIFERYFEVEHLIVHVSADGLRHRRSCQANWEILTRKFTERDLLTSGLTVWLRPLHTGMARGREVPSHETAAR
jgi:SAM-dependent methyltransferase